MRKEPNVSESPQPQQRQVLPLIQQKLKEVFLLPFYHYKIDVEIRQRKTPKELYKILVSIDRWAKVSEPQKEQYLEQQAFEQRVRKELAQGMVEIAKERGCPEIFTALEQELQEQGRDQRAISTAIATLAYNLNKVAEKLKTIPLCPQPPKQ